MWRLNARPSSDVSASSSRKLENISARLATLVQQSQSASADIVRRIAEVRLTQKGQDLNHDPRPKDFIKLIASGRT